MRRGDNCGPSENQRDLLPSVRRYSVSGIPFFRLSGERRVFNPLAAIFAGTRKGISVEERKLADSAEKNLARSVSPSLPPRRLFVILYLDLWKVALIRYSTSRNSRPRTDDEFRRAAAIDCSPREKGRNIRKAYRSFRHLSDRRNRETDEES